MPLSIQETGDRLDPGRITKIMQEWPPDDELNRFAGYEKQQMIYDGNHKSAFNRKEQQTYPEYIMCNISEVIPNTFADLLFGEDVTLELEKGASKEDIEWVNTFWADQELQVKCFEASIDCGIAGDSLLTVWRNEGEEVMVSAVPADSWIPDQNPDNIRDIRSHTVWWNRKIIDKEGEHLYVKMRIYEKGFIRNELWAKDANRLIRPIFPGQNEWELLMGDVKEQEDVPEVPDDFLLIHIPNFRTSKDYFGRGDFDTTTSMMSALDARMTQTDAILSRFADPKFKGPKELVDEDGYYDSSENAFIGLEDKDEDTTGYIVYEAKLEESRALMEILVDKILLLGGIDRAVLGMEAGAGPISGRALKFKLMRTLAKVARKRKYWSAAITQMFNIAQLLAKREPKKVTVRFADGLPQDNEELMMEVAQRRALELIGRKRAIERLDNVSPEDAQEQIDDIDAEGSAENRAVGNALANRPRPVFGRPPDLEEEG